MSSERRPQGSWRCCLNTRPKRLLKAASSLERIQDSGAAPGSPTAPAKSLFGGLVTPPELSAHLPLKGEFMKALSYFLSEFKPGHCRPVERPGHLGLERHSL